MSPVAVTLIGCAAVLALDALGSLAARRVGFRYELLAPLSLLLYAGTGYLAARAGGHFLAGSAAGAAVAAVEGTLGWRVARAVGVEDERDVSERLEVRVTAIVALAGALLGTLAGLVA